MSKNAITVEQIQISCRHVDELLHAGVTENMAIRTLELFVDTYAKINAGGSATPHHVDQVELWSKAALAIREKNPNAVPKDNFRVEHGTPRRQLARLILEGYRNEMLNEHWLSELVGRLWRLAVITLDEDKVLNSIARSSLYNSPEARWQAAGIEFP
jgi:hypothetical protein